MNDRFLSLLGLARRAGRLSMGFDAACESAVKGEAALILATNDVSAGSLKRLSAAAQEHGTELVLLGCGMETLASAVGKSVRMVSVNDEGFAGKLRLLLKEDEGSS